jgi:hypothetical protein
MNVVVHIVWIVNIVNILWIYIFLYLFAWRPWFWNFEWIHMIVMRLNEFSLWHGVSVKILNEFSWLISWLLPRFWMTFLSLFHDCCQDFEWIFFTYCMIVMMLNGYFSFAVFLLVGWCGCGVNIPPECVLWWNFRRDHEVAPSWPEPARDTLTTAGFLRGVIILV